MEQKIRKVCNGLAEMLVRKNTDYGDSFAESYNEFGLSTSIIRMQDKLNRLKTLTRASGVAVSDESIVDTLYDLAGYAVLSIGMLDTIPNIVTSDTTLKTYADYIKDALCSCVVTNMAHTVEYNIDKSITICLRRGDVSNDVIVKITGDKPRIYAQCKSYQTQINKVNVIHGNNTLKILCYESEYNVAENTILEMLILIPPDATDTDFVALGIEEIDTYIKVNHNMDIDVLTTDKPIKTQMEPREIDLVRGASPSL